MTQSAGHCDLCGLPLRFGSQRLDVRNLRYRFCCTGCKMVFTMLLEAGDSEDPEKFKETELFRRCMEMGLVPASEEELARMANVERAPDSSKTLNKGETENDERLLAVKLKISGMWCPACAWAIEESLKKQPGVAAAACNFSTDRLTFRYDPVTTTPDRVEALLTQLGYPPLQEDDPDASQEKKREFVRFAISALLTANIMMLSVALYTGFFSELSAETIAKISWPMAFMAGVVFFYGGSRIHQRAWTGIVHAAPGMETLVSMGASAAFFYSLAGTITGSIHQYYDTASMLITLILIGKGIEKKARTEVNRELESFFERKPEKVKLCSRDWPKGRYVHADQLRPGDLFMVGNGEMVAADGTVINGEAMVDESAITGEARPAGKKPGASVAAGTFVRSGGLTVRATAVGTDSTLGRMMDIMERTLDRKTPLEGKTDRILHGFVPLIATLAIATAAACLILDSSIDAAVIRGVTVLVIACPCALGIAIPLARVSGISMARNIGILVNNFSAFESVEKIDTVVLDKTGTVTEGNWRIQNAAATGSLCEEELIAVAAGLEADNTHLIAEEIRRYAAAKKIVPATIASRKEHQNGIRGTWQGKTVRIGSFSFAGIGVKELSAIDPTADSRLVTSQVFISLDATPCGVISFGDRLKPTSASAIDRLMDDGYALCLVSGDNEATVAEVARQIGISSFAGGKKPAEKADVIQQLKDSGKMVSMVGDGVNDAPALARSHVAVAVPTGAHPGWEATDVTLMKGDLAQIHDFIGLARRVNRTINQNLFLAFGYNFLAIPIAMSGLLSPPLAALAMVVSSLSVTGNTLRMIRSK